MVCILFETFETPHRANLKRFGVGGGGAVAMSLLFDLFLDQMNRDRRIHIERKCLAVILLVHLADL